MADDVIKQAARVIHGEVVLAAQAREIDIQVHDTTPSIRFERGIARALADAGLLRLAAHDDQVRAKERERIAQAIVDELARTTATARPEACEYADEGYCHTEAREQALEDATRIARACGND